MKRVLFLIVNVLLFLNLFSQYNNSKPSAVKWLTMQEVLKLHDSIPKTILIDMYTSWCGWCKKMDAETFQNPNIADYINQNFYPVKFNAEGFDTIVYKGKTYTNSGIGNRPPHQLAIELLGGKMSYPTIVYIDFEGNVNAVPGYMSVADMEPVLVYFSERINKAVDYGQYLQDFKNTFNPDSTAKTDGNINWLDINQCIELMATKPKKIFLFVNSDFNNSSKLVLASVLRHPVIADYINKNFYPVKLNFDHQDSIFFNDGVFINEQRQIGYPHQFIIAILQPDIRLPSIVFFDEEFRIITPVRGYCPASTIERYLEFFSRDKYKINEDWLEFNKNFKSKL